MIILSQSGVGISKNTIHLLIYNFTLADGYWMMFVGGLISLLLGLYLEYVLPKTYGKRYGLCFCITCFFPAPPRRRQKVHQESVNHELKYLDPDAYEDVPLEVQQQTQSSSVLTITDLKKKYSNGFKAVRGVNLKMYSG